MAYRIYFSNFHYYSANESNTLEGAKKIARAAEFDSIIELDGEAICTFSWKTGFVNVSDSIIDWANTG